MFSLSVGGHMGCAGHGWQEGPRDKGEQQHRPHNLCLRKQQVTLRTSAHQCPMVLVLPKPAGPKRAPSTVASCLAHCHL